MNNPLDTIYNGDITKYRLDVVACPNPRERVFQDIRSILESITEDDIRDNLENIHQAMFIFPPKELAETDKQPIVFDYLSALNFWIQDKLIVQWRLLAFVIEADTIETDTFGHQIITEDKTVQREKSASEMYCLIDKRIRELGLYQMPSELGQMMTKQERDLLNELEKESKNTNIRERSDTAILSAYQKLTNLGETKLKHAGQVSLFDDGILVDPWKGDNSRKISITQKSKNRTPVEYVFGVDNYKDLTKGNVQADKCLTYMSEKLLDIDFETRAEGNGLTIEFDIKEYAELTGSDYMNAKHELHKASDLLTCIKQKISNSGGYIVVFPKVLIGESKDPNGKPIGKRGTVIIEKSPDISLIDGGEFTSLFPRHLYRLNQNSWYLGRYVYAIIRNDAKNTTGANYEKDISLITVMSKLNLPHPDNTRRIQQLIIDPLSKAIESFNTMEKQNGGTVTLSLKIDYQLSPRERINQGKLHIKVKSGEYLDRIRGISSRRIEHIKDAQQKAQRKEDRANDAKSREFARLERKEKNAKDQESKPKTRNTDNR